MLVGPTRRSGAASVNEELIRIANQPPTPFPELAPDATRDEAQAAENFLGGPAVMKICEPDETCDVRTAYYTKYNSNWTTILAALGNAAGKCRRDSPNPQVCEDVREQLFDEVEATNRVRFYLGPEGLQRPFGAARISALANLGAISQAIANAVQPPAQSATTSRALTIMSYLVRVGALAGPQASALAAVTGSAFALLGYLTAPDNSPNLIGAEVRATADQLGVKLGERYQLAGDQLDGLGSIIVSDYGKLTAVARRVDSNPNWIIGSPAAAREELVRAAKQTFSEALIPVAYPVLYDLGLVPNRNAAFWRCKGVAFGGASQKFLFDRNPSGAQVVQRFPGNWKPVMAVGGTTTVGRGNTARIPTPPAAVIDPLFAPQALGGLDMRKLEFYGPRLFRLFPQNPAPGASAMSYRSEGAQPVCSSIPNPPNGPGAGPG
jgi:hypothetical protein